MSQEKARCHATVRDCGSAFSPSAAVCPRVLSLARSPRRLPLYARFPRLHQALLQAPTRYACPLVFPAFCAKRSTPKLNLIYLFWLFLIGSDLIVSVFMYYYASWFRSYAKNSRVYVCTSMSFAGSAPGWDSRLGRHGYSYTFMKD